MKHVTFKICILIFTSVISISSLLGSSSQAKTDEKSPTLSDAVRSRNAAIAHHMENLEDECVDENEDAIKKGFLDKQGMPNMDKRDKVIALDEGEQNALVATSVRLALKNKNISVIDKLLVQSAQIDLMYATVNRHYSILGRLDEQYPNQHSHENIEGKKVKRLEYALLADLRPTRVEQNAQK